MLSYLTSRDGKHQAFRRLVALGCVLLILFVGAAQTLHVHAQNEAANPGCSLCAVAHVSVLPASVPAGPVVVHAVAPVVQALRASAPKPFFAFNLHVRPPPVSTARS